MAITTPNPEDLKYIKNSWENTSQLPGPALEPYRRTHEHVGHVLKVYKRDYRAMSDIHTSAEYALVWTAEGAREVFVNANFECDVSGRFADVDATPEVLAAYELSVRTHDAIVLAAAKAQAERRAAEHAKFAALTRVGAKVVITRPKRLAGTVGEVFWVRGERIGVDVTGKRDAKNMRVDPVFTKADSVELAP